MPDYERITKRVIGTEGRNLMERSGMRNLFSPDNEQITKRVIGKARGEEGERISSLFRK